MIVSLDKVCSRYGTLPSQALMQGTTFDLHVADLSLRYELYLKNKAKGKVETPKYSQEQLLEIINTAKEKKNGKR